MSTIVSAFLSNVNSREDKNIYTYYNYGKLLLKSSTPKIIFLDEIMFDLIDEDYEYIYNNDIYKDILWYFAGGVFGGNKNMLLEFSDLMKTKCIEIITTKNTIMWEVNIWYLIYNDNKELFDGYYCDHNDSIIDNY